MWWGGGKTERHQSWRWSIIPYYQAGHPHPQGPEVTFVCMSDLKKDASNIHRLCRCLLRSFRNAPVLEYRMDASAAGGRGSAGPRISVHVASSVAGPDERTILTVVVWCARYTVIHRVPWLKTKNPLARLCHHLGGGKWQRPKSPHTTELVVQKSKPYQFYLKV